MTALCKTYYVDPQTGRDTNDGLTPEKPLATLFAVNQLALAPGDTVLLKCGSVFEKQFLHLRCCGKKDSPITIAAYGEGPAPRIDADGQGLETRSEAGRPHRRQGLRRRLEQASGARQDGR